MPTLTPDLIEKLSAVAASKGISLEALLWQWLALYWEPTAQSVVPSDHAQRLENFIGMFEDEGTDLSSSAQAPVAQPEIASGESA
jgi:molybdopterin-guanine dinucleotide biosynthesis protein A